MEKCNGDMGVRKTDSGKKAIKAEIVLEGVEKYRESLRLIKEDMDELNDSLQSVNDNMERFAKSVKDFSNLFR